MTTSIDFRMEGWISCSLIILLSHFLTEIRTETFCVKEGGCITLKCPLRCRGRCFTVSDEEAGPIYIVRWTHLNHTDTKIRKNDIDEEIVYGGKFKEGVQVLENGDIKIFDVSKSFTGSYSCDVFPRFALNVRSTDGTVPLKLLVVSESDPSPTCEPEDQCRSKSDPSPICEPEDQCSDEKGLNKNVVLGLTVAGSILGIIFLIFAILCSWSKWQQGRHKESESAAYGNHKSVPQSSVSVPSSAVKENSNYETIPYDSGRNVHEIKREDDYERQDSGIEVDDTKGTPHKYGPRSEYLV